MQKIGQRIHLGRWACNVMEGVINGGTGRDPNDRLIPRARQQHAVGIQDIALLLNTAHNLPVMANKAPRAPLP
jgi:hypothetical protein